MLGDSLITNLTTQESIYENVKHRRRALLGNTVSAASSAHPSPWYPNSCTPTLPDEEKKNLQHGLDQLKALRKLAHQFASMYLRMSGFQPENHHTTEGGYASFDQ